MRLTSVELTRFTRGVKPRGTLAALPVGVTAREVLAADALAGLFDGDGFGVGHGVVGLSDEIGTFSQDLAVADDETGERTAAILDVLAGDLKRSIDELVVCSGGHGRTTSAGAMDVRKPAPSRVFSWRGREQ